MTLRHKLADWISGGELTRRTVLFLQAARKLNELDNAKAEALRAIIAQETPSANATVRRMARIAREALE